MLPDRSLPRVSWAFASASCGLSVAIANLQKQSADHYPAERVSTLVGEVYRVSRNTDRAPVIIKSATMSEHSALGSPGLKPSLSSLDSLTDYKYKPLPTSPATIRLCAIHIPSTSAFEEPVVCSTHNFKLDVAARIGYCALSYAWGEPNFDQTLAFNGYPLRVTSHLCKALQRLRSHGIKWVWVDAICIDRSNTLERNAQVSLMGRRYSSAEFTAICLGEADEQETRAVGLMMHLSVLYELVEEIEAGHGSPQSLDTLLDTLPDHLGPDHPYLAEYKHKANKQWRKSSGAASDDAASDGAVSDGAVSDDAMSANAASNGAVSDEVMSDGAASDDEASDLSPIGSAVRLVALPDNHSPLWASLMNIYSRPWFWRGWIVQEAVLSRQAIMMVGEDYFEFERLVSSLHFVTSIHLFSHSRIRLPRQILVPLTIEKIRRGNESRNLIHLLHLLPSCRTTDPRDKIYCLLGIADDVRVAHKPDYSQAVEAVYRSYAVHFIRNCEHLNLIRHSGIAQGASRPDGTWVPRWDRLSHIRIVDSPISGECNFHASGQVQAYFALEEEASLLKVRGMRFDSRYEFCSQTVSSETFKDWIPWERSLSCSVQKSPRFSTERYAEALVMNGNGEGVNNYSARSKIPNITLKDAYESNFAPEMTNQWQFRPYFYDFRSNAEDNGFVLTSRGHFGWVPKEAETSDIIYIIFGVSVPLVPREVEDGRYILIGSAYIEGIMQGEAISREDLIVEDSTLM